MSYFLRLRYRTGLQIEHCCGSRLAAERLAHHLTRRGFVARWEIVEGGIA